jgi:hypothetical protein
MKLPCNVSVLLWSHRSIPSDIELHHGIGHFVFEVQSNWITCFGHDRHMIKGLFLSHLSPITCPRYPKRSTPLHPTGSHRTRKINQHRHLKNASYKLSTLPDNSRLLVLATMDHPVCSAETQGRSRIKVLYVCGFPFLLSQNPNTELRNTCPKCLPRTTRTRQLTHSRS